MTKKRKIEVFSAGCPVCIDAIDLINKINSPSCDIAILDTHQKEVADRAKKLGIKRVPAVVVDGKLAESCCGGCGVDESALRATVTGN